MAGGWVEAVFSALAHGLGLVVSFLLGHIEVCIALVALGWAVYQFRWSAGKADVYDKMSDQFANSRRVRASVNGEYPWLMAKAYLEISEVSALKVRLASEIRTWSDLGVSYTAAHEVMSSEYKLRALIWAIAQVRDPYSSVWESPDDWEEKNALAKKCVEQLNDFATYYENGVYPRSVVLGKLHAGLAIPAKALEPLIWSRSTEGARWGRRVLRIGIRAQDYNDRTGVQQINSIYWTRGGARLLVHPALVQGGEEGGPLINWPKGQDRRLYAIPRSRWTLRGSTMLRNISRVANREYGGRRLKYHEREESSLVRAIRAAE